MSKIVLVLRGRIHAGFALFALLALAAGCGKRVTARAPAKPVPIGWTQTGIASWYGAPYDGRRAASGEIFDTKKLTAAHRTLPFDTWVEVTNLQTRKRVDVRINDRGPFVDGRIIDLSFAAADRIDVTGPGTGKVRLKVIRAPKPSDQQPDPPSRELAGQPQTQTQSKPQSTFVVQAGAFSDPVNANAQREKLGADARVLKTGSLYRVLVGSSLTRDAAESLAGQLRASGTDAIVVADPAPPTGND